MTLALSPIKSGLLALCAAAIMSACAAPDEDTAQGVDELSSEEEAPEVAESAQPLVALSSSPDYLRCICRDETTSETSEAQICANTSCSSGTAMAQACQAACGTRTVTGAACFEDAPRCTQSSGTPTLGTLSSTPNVLECTCGDNSTPQAAVSNTDCSSRTAELNACTSLCGARGSARAARCVRGTKRLADVPLPRFGTVKFDSTVGGYVGDRSYSSRNLQVGCSCTDGRRDIVCAPSDTTNGSTWTLNANSCSTTFARNTCSDVCGSPLNVTSTSCLSSAGRYSWLFTFSSWNEGNDLCFWGAPKPNMVECTCNTRNFRICADIKASATPSTSERYLLNNQLRDVCTPVCAGFGGYVPNAFIAQETYSSMCTYSNM